MDIVARGLAAKLSRLLLSGYGVPDDAAYATVNVNPTGNDNGLTFTALAPGVGGNEISIVYVDPEENDAALTVTVSGAAITVNLATSEVGAITTTAAEIKTAIEAHAVADTLVAVTILTSDTGTGDDGSGVVTAMAEASLTGGAGTGIGVLAKGGMYIDETNGNVYRNSGTTAEPAYTQLSDV